MRKLIVLNVAALSHSLFERCLDRLPNLSRIAEQGQAIPMMPVFPAVTCPAQASLLTGTYPTEHGVVANGIYLREINRVSFWEQSSREVAGRRFWTNWRLTRKDLKVAVLFWQNSLGLDAEVILTPKPVHLPNGEILQACYGKPDGLYPRLVEKLGPFDLKTYWGPMAGLASSRWIINALRQTLEEEAPTLSLCYLPHLDYPLQRFGPDDPRIQVELQELDALLDPLVALLDKEYEIVVVSEYGITAVSQAIPINRILRKAGLLSVYRVGEAEYLDPDESKAFAMVDHQVAHLYLREPKFEAEVREALSRTPGLDTVTTPDELPELHVRHPRAGDLIAISKPNAWFSYYWWEEDRHAPAFARTVDIHQKPGYDPVELFFDPKTKSIPLDPSLVKGSHGAPATLPEQKALFLSSRKVTQAAEVQQPQVPALLRQIVE